MAQARLVEIRPPLGGVHRSSAYQDQQPYTCRDAKNVFPLDVWEQRDLVGTRPGLTRYAPTPGSTPIRMLTQAMVRTSIDAWADFFKYDDASHYLPVDNWYIEEASRLPDFERSRFYVDPAEVAEPEATSVALNPIPNFDSSKEFQVSIYIDAPQRSAEQFYHIFFNTASTPDGDNCYVAELQFKSADGQWDLRVDKITAGVYGDSSFVSGSDGAALQGWFTVQCNGTACKVYWRGELVMTKTLATGVDATRPGLGFGMYLGVTPNPATMQVSGVRVEYHRATAFSTVRPFRYYSQGGTLYKESYRGIFAASAATRTLASDRQIMAAEFNEKIIVADNSEVLAEGTDGQFEFNAGPTFQFDSATYTNWETILNSVGIANVMLVIPPDGLQTVFADPTAVVNANGPRMGVQTGLRIKASVGTFALTTIDDLLVISGNGINGLDREIHIQGFANDVKTAIDSITWYPENGDYTGDYTMTVERLVDFRVVDTTVYQFTSAGAGTMTLTTIEIPADTSVPDIVRLRVSPGLATLVTTTGITFYEGSASAGTIVMQGTPLNVDNALKRWVHVPDSKYAGKFVVTLERLSAYGGGVIGETIAFNRYVGQGLTYVGNHRITAITGSGAKLTVQPADAQTLVTSGATPPEVLGNNLRFRIERGPKVYDPVADTLEPLWATGGRGSVPTGASIVWTANGCLWFAGFRHDPCQWAKSRQGDENDWRYTDSDVGAAAYGGSNPFAGKTSSPIVAACSILDTYSILWTETSIVRISDLASGGSIDTISPNIGIVARDAWCRGRNPTEVFFIARAGLYVLTAGGDVQPLSENVIPLEIANLNRLTTDISMGYSAAHNGIFIFLTPKVAATSNLPANITHWFFSLENKGFWPVVFGNKSHNPTCCLSLTAADIDDDGILLGGVGGGINRFSWTAETDDGTDIEDSLLLGPMKCSPDSTRFGMVEEMSGVLAADSANVTMTLRARNRPEEIITAKANDPTMTLRAGAMRYMPFRRSGTAYGVLLEGQGRPWAFEVLSARISDIGKAR